MQFRELLLQVEHFELELVNSMTVRRLGHHRPGLQGRLQLHLLLLQRLVETEEGGVLRLEGGAPLRQPGLKEEQGLERSHLASIALLELAQNVRPPAAWPRLHSYVQSRSVTITDR